MNNERIMGFSAAKKINQDELQAVSGAGEDTHMYSSSVQSVGSPSVDVVYDF